MFCRKYINFVSGMHFADGHTSHDFVKGKFVQIFLSGIAYHLEKHFLYFNIYIKTSILIRSFVRWQTSWN